jgi:putative endonuclease
MGAGRWVAYILLSEVTGCYYKGSSGDLERRLKEHNRGKVLSTKSGCPWSLIYYEGFQTRSDALQREKYFKTRSGYRWLKTQGIIE